MIIQRPKFFERIRTYIDKTPIDMLVSSIFIFVVPLSGIFGLFGSLWHSKFERWWFYFFLSFLFFISLSNCLSGIIFIVKKEAVIKRGNKKLLGKSAIARGISTIMIGWLGFVLILAILTQ